MAAKFKRYKVKKLLLGLAIFNASATPALTVGEDYIDAGEAITYIQTKNAEIGYEVEQLDRMAIWLDAPQAARRGETALPAR